MDPQVIDPQYPLNEEAAKQYLNNFALFKSKARRWTQKYAK